MSAPDISRNWNCTVCGEVVDAGFEQCWNCGCLYDGSPDPDVAREAVIEKAEHWENVRCECGFVGPGYEIEGPYNLFAEFFGYLMAKMTGVGFTTRSKIRCCPLCHSSSDWLPTNTEPSKEAILLSQQEQTAYHSTRAHTRLPILLAILLVLVVQVIGYVGWVWLCGKTN